MSIVGSRAENRRRIEQLEREILHAYYGDLPWLDLPPEPGWYWFRVVPSTVIRGPVRVRLIDGRLVAMATAVSSYSTSEKPVEHFQRQWAGPLARPVEPINAEET